MDPTPNPLEGYEGLTGKHRTQLDCHNCSKDFYATLDYDIEGNHIIECPWCSHEHCRLIEKGRVTADRWSSRHQRVDVSPAFIWRAKINGKVVETSTASMFIRERWLNRSDRQ